MAKLKIVVRSKGKDTITKTIRMSGEIYDKIVEIAEKNNLSFNNVANQFLKYAVENLDDGEKRGFIPLFFYINSMNNRFCLYL